MDTATGTCAEDLSADILNATGGESSLVKHAEEKQLWKKKSWISSQLVPSESLEDARRKQNAWNSGVNFPELDESGSRSIIITL
jgi:hypothetical protein